MKPQITQKRTGLQNLNGTLHARWCQYDFARCNALVHQWRLPLRGGAQKLTLCESRWQVQCGAEPVATDAEATDLTVTFACTSGTLAQASLTVDLDFSAWSVNNYVLLPGAAYAGNRFLARRIPYSPKLYYVQDIGPDKPIIITDVPRLNSADGPSGIQERSGSMATPAIGFYAPKLRRGFLLLAPQGNTLGDYGLSIAETRDRRQAVISLTAPVVRELYSYRICDAQYPSLDPPHDFAAGDAVAISFRVYTFVAPAVQALFDKFAAVRKDLAPRRPAPNTLPYAACLDLQEKKFNRENFVPRHGYYSVGPRTNFLQDWQIGWTGGMITTYPLLFAGNARTRRHVLRNFDWLFPDGIAPSGFFWDCGAHGTQWIGGDIRKPHTANWHLIRKSGDGVFYIIKQFQLMAELGIPVKPAWRNGTRRVCDAFVKLWKRYGQFGQFVDSLTGEIRVGGSTSGAIIPAALVLAARYFRKPAYLEVAQQAGDLFYRDFTRKGLSCGGPGDAVQNPDSESWYALIESYFALYEATGHKRWLQRAAETARQFASWVVSYDFQFPPRSTFAKAGIRTTGAVYANTQNKHAAPGLCTYSGLALLQLFRATGDKYYLELLHDIAHNLPQYLAHPLKPLGKAGFGHMCERVNLTDWEGPERIGETLNMSTWAETSLLLTAIEIPGLYVQPDQSLVVAFDNVQAEVVADTASQFALRVTNPTPAPARVSVWAESSAAAAQPLPPNYLHGRRAVELAPGAAQILIFPR